MSDVGWGSDHLEPPKKRTIPLWVMGCAGGCMFVIGAAAVALWIGGGMFKRWVATQSKPELQWPRLAEALPFDEQPAGFTIARWPVPLIDLSLWQLESKGQDLVLYALSAPDRGSGAIWGEWLSSPKKSMMFSLQEGEFETSEGTLMLQGRELRVVHFTRTGLPDSSAPPVTPLPPIPPEKTSPGGGEEVEGSILRAIERNKEVLGSGLALDVTPEGSERRVLVWLVRVHAGATVSDDEAKTILEPFKIGPAH